MNTTDTEGPTFFVIDEVPWPDETQGATVPKELIEQARKSGARRKYLARGHGGFFSQYSEFPPGFGVPPHTHDHDEMIIVLEGSCTMMGDGGQTLHAHDSMVLKGGYEYGFTAGPDGMTFMTIRTAAASTALS